jgi:hypothetical protein
MRIVLNLNSFVAVNLTSDGLSRWQEARASVPPLAAGLQAQKRLTIRLSELIRVFGPAIADKRTVFEDGDLTALPERVQVGLLDPT